jgi:hypothetical protein
MEIFEDQGVFVRVFMNNFWICLKISPSRMRDCAFMELCPDRRGRLENQSGIFGG